MHELDCSPQKSLSDPLSIPVALQVSPQQLVLPSPQILEKLPLTDSGTRRFCPAVQVDADRAYHIHTCQQQCIRVCAPFLRTQVLRMLRSGSRIALFIYLVRSVLLVVVHELTTTGHSPPVPPKWRGNEEAQGTTETK